MKAKSRQEPDPISLMLDDVRAAIGRCRNVPEKDVYEALCAEADGWKMRLEELEED